MDGPKTRISLCVMAINENGEVLLMRRFNTGYQDGKFEFPSGHIENNENSLDGTKRELKEESDLDVELDDLDYLGVVDNNTKGNHFNMLYKTTKFSGVAKVMEPKECDRLEWVSLELLLSGKSDIELSTDTLRSLIMIKNGLTYMIFDGNEDLIEMLKKAHIEPYKK